MPIILPVEQPANWVVSGFGETYTGTTILGNMTGVALLYDIAYGEGEMASLEAMMEQHNVFPPLPDSVWLEPSAVYQWDDTLVMVRQSHNRTGFDPDETPALFCVYREGAGDVLEWVAGEQVLVGTRRLYNTIEYRCLQAHVTQTDWTPPSVPALWSTTIVPGAEWSPGVFYDTDALAMYAGTEYVCIQAHVSQVGWEPPSAITLWRLSGPPTQEWQPYTQYTGDNTAGSGNGDVVTYGGNTYRCLQTHNSIPTWTPPAVPALWLLL